MGNLLTKAQGTLRLILSPNKACALLRRIKCGRFSRVAEHPPLEVAASHGPDVARQQRILAAYGAMKATPVGLDQFLTEKHAEIDREELRSA